MIRFAALLSAALALSLASAHATLAPTFNDPVALVTWLISNSGHGFDADKDDTTTNVFSPGLRAALRATFARSRQRNEPPCGADGDIILDSQEDGVPENLKVSAQPTASDRQTVAASFDIVGYHRTRRYMTVLLDGTWKLENILEPSGASLRRSLGCGR